MSIVTEISSQLKLKLLIANRKAKINVTVILLSLFISPSIPDTYADVVLHYFNSTNILIELHTN